LALGHPILGDRFYGPQEAQDAKRLHLHALQLTLLHPYRAESMTFGAPQPF